MLIPGVMLNKLFTIGSLRRAGGQVGVRAGNFALGLRNDTTRSCCDISLFEPCGNALAAASS